MLSVSLKKLSFGVGTLQSKTSESTKPTNPSLCWQNPPQSWHKVKVDANASFKDDYAGIGVLICNSKGQVVAVSPAIIELDFLNIVKSH